MTPDDPLRTPGEVLVEARERSGFSLAELAERTKIAPPMLEAIERDEYHRLSDPLYVKSFLRSYAAEVGLEPDEVLDLYARSTGAATPISAGEGVWKERPVTINRVGLPWGRIVPVAVGLAVAVLVVVLLVRGCGGEKPDSATAAVRPEANEATARRESLLAPIGEQESVDAEPVTADPILIGGATAADTDEEDAQPPASVEPDPQPVATTPEPARSRELPPALTGEPSLNMAGPYRGDLVLRILATTTVRARVRRDGEHVYRTVNLAGGDGDEDPLPAMGIVPGRAYAVREGSVVYWRARDHFSLKLDPVEGVSVTVNGRERDLGRLRPGQEMILDALAAD